MHGHMVVNMVNHGGEHGEHHGSGGSNHRGGKQITLSMINQQSQQCCYCNVVSAAYHALQNGMISTSGVLHMLHGSSYIG